MTTAIVLLSGGQDSTTCLAWAVAKYGRENVETVSFDYGQRHRVELDQARQIAQTLDVDNDVLKVDALRVLGAASLTNPGIANVGDGPSVNVYAEKHGLPPSFVPGRNAIFFSTAAAYAAFVGARVLVTGICGQDFAGYPDCRPEFRTAMEAALRQALDDPEFELAAPLLTLTKAQTWALADELGVLEVVRTQTHTCYEGDRETLHDWGYGCGACGACQERARGYDEWTRSTVSTAGPV